MKTCPTCGREFPDNVKFCPNDGQTLRSKGPTADLVGQVVADRYHILKKLGEGGMGAVYLGEHVKMGRKSAIKVMAAAMSQDPDAIARFNREASNASRISHPNVCQIYDFGETPDGLIYLAMEFIEGQALTDLIEREGALPPPRAARILKQAADALQAAHDLGIVHRDIKPDNIMVIQGRDGTDIVKVVDFGIARAVGGDESGQKVTKTGLVVGTPEYMSPEQLSGDKLDGRSDIYSLALVLYRMLTGVLPFQADSAQETMIKRLTDDPMPLMETRPDIAFPPALQVVLDRALARMPADRYQSAAQFGNDTMAAVEGLEVIPGTRVAESPGGATQLMSAGEVEAATKAQSVRKPGPKAPAAKAAAAAAQPAPKKSTMPVAIIIGVAVVAALGGVAMLLKSKPPTVAVRDTTAQSQSNTTQTQTSNPQPAQPSDLRPRPSQPQPNQPQPASNQPQPNQPQPNQPGGGVSIADSLARMDDLIDASQWSSARTIGMFVWTSAASSGAQKARAARAIANTFLEEGNTDQAINWLRNSRRYEPNNQAALTLLQQLGVEP